MSIPNQNRSNIHGRSRIDPVRGSGMDNQSVIINIRDKPQIQLIPRRLLNMNGRREFFYPEVVSIGPYHHGKFVHTERLKQIYGEQFLLGSVSILQIICSAVSGMLDQVRGCYSDGSTTTYDNEEFTKMMVADGMFILHFMDCTVNKKHYEPTISPYTRTSIIRDLFLLENQLPYAVLMVLMMLKYTRNEGEKMLHEFLNLIISPPGCSSSIGDHTDQQPIHLLDLLRIKLIGTDRPKSDPSHSILQTFRSVNDLKAVGIKLRRSQTSCIKDIHFQPHMFQGKLSLPPIVVDDLSETRFLNLIAYEMCPDARLEYAVTSYIYFFDSLIDCADDVKELRSKGILYNCLGSDNQVSDLFNQLSKELVPDLNAYYEVIKGIELHCKSKMRVSISQFVHTHFSSPWTAIAFLAATYVIILTSIQSYFAVFPKK